MGGRPSKDMKRSHAPGNVSPGSLIPCVAATKLEKIKITAKLDLGHRNCIMWDSFFLILKLYTVPTYVLQGARVDKI
jgi:hypothetical protein